MSAQIINQYAGFMDFTRFDTAIKACEMIASSSFCPTDFKNKTGDVLCAIQYGMEVGLSPMQALQNIAVINGKPSIYGDALIALCLSFPECEDIQESFDESTMVATCKVKRKGMSWVIKTYSKQDAEIAKLWGKKTYQGKDTPWITYPKRMLQMRARGFALRDAFADRLKGIITVEEARDYPVREEKPLNVVTPIKPNMVIGNALPAPRRELISQDTKSHLIFLMGELQLSNEVKTQWFDKLKVSSIEELSEAKAKHEIQKIEAKYPEAAKAWIEIVSIRNEVGEPIVLQK